MKGLVRSRPDPFVSALPIFPGRRQPSIFGASELNCRVRDGNGWTLTAISTDFVCATYAALSISTVFTVKTYSVKKMVTRGRVELPFAA